MLLPGKEAFGNSRMLAISSVLLRSSIGSSSYQQNTPPTSHMQSNIWPNSWQHIRRGNLHHQQNLQKPNSQNIFRTPQSFESYHITSTKTQNHEQTHGTITIPFSAKLLWSLIPFPFPSKKPAKNIICLWCYCTPFVFFYYLSQQHHWSFVSFRNSTSSGHLYKALWAAQSLHLQGSQNMEHHNSWNTFVAFHSFSQMNRYL